MFEKAKINKVVWSDVFGWGKIIEIVPKHDNPIKCKFGDKVYLACNLYGESIGGQIRINQRKGEICK